ncbi:MAG: ammonium transporter [Cyanobacteriota bacterium]|nr:ammonium transporter [Cyanobacteriota bacterium]
MLDLNIAWIIVSAGLVFLMQPGFMCLECGLTRSKNSINVAVKNLADFAISVILFWAFGYALMFGASRLGWIGSSRFFLELTTQPESAAFFIFQVMFCGTATTIVSGAVAERLRFIAYLVIVVLISGLIYPVFGHWVWGGAETGDTFGWLAQLGFIDFAGSTVVHGIGGWVALGALLVIGPRKGRFTADGRSQKIRGSNLPLSVLGAMLLWFGWLGFNGGSTLAFDDRVPGIIANTVIAGATGMLAATALGWQRRKVPEVELAINGSIAGLVAITAGCHAVTTPLAAIIGATGGAVMMLGLYWMERLGIDDGVDAVAVHGIAGAWGTLCVALFGNAELLGTGLSRYAQLGVQLAGVGAGIAWAFGLSYGVLFLINRVFCLRVSPEEEDLGLNVSEHQAKTEVYDVFEVMDEQAKTQNFSLRAPEEPFTEAGKIAYRYNQVMNSLETKAQELSEVNEELEQTIDNRNAEILERKRAEEEARLLLDISQVVSSAPSFELALELALRRVCQTTGWSYGEIWVPSADKSAVECSPIWFFDDAGKSPAEIAALQAFRQHTSHTTFHERQGLPGRVWKSKQVEWIPNFELESAEAFVRSELARQCGLNGALGVPIIGPMTARSIDEGDLNEVLAVLVFLIPASHSREGDDRLVQLISAVASQLGTVVQQKKAEKALRQKNEELAQTLQQLQATQQQLVDSEKLAVLGQLIAGIAHEINTPLGAIRASVQYIQNFLEGHLSALPTFFQELSPVRQEQFLGLLARSRKQVLTFSSRERRKLRRSLVAHLNDRNIANADSTADLLMDLGAYEDLDPFLPLLEDADCEEVLKMVYQFASLQDSTQNIITASDRAAKVVFALKTYARYDNSGETMPVNTIDGIETILTLYQNQLKQGVEVIRNYPKQLSIVQGYPDELNQVWTNLIHNALQAMGNRGTLTIGISEDTDAIHVRITDSGSGIPEEIQAKIFQPFFTTKPPGEGSGLGLDIVKKIIDKHQGSIEVQSIPGQTEFSISLSKHLTEDPKAL